jgi:hypothetical protein
VRPFGSPGDLASTEESVGVGDFAFEPATGLPDSPGCHAGLRFLRLFGFGVLFGVSTESLFPYSIINVQRRAAVQPLVTAAEVFVPRCPPVSRQGTCEPVRLDLKTG